MHRFATFLGIEGPHPDRVLGLTLALLVALLGLGVTSGTGAVAVTLVVILTGAAVWARGRRNDTLDLTGLVPVAVMVAAASWGPGGHPPLSWKAWVVGAKAGLLVNVPLLAVRYWRDAHRPPSGVTPRCADPKPR